MADKAMDVYLNDHLAGAMFGSDLARQIESQSEGTELAPRARELATRIEEDHQTLSDLMQRMGVTKNPVKQATTWLAEKFSRVKLTGLSSGEGELGLFLALETLSLGVEGKASLWRMLKDVEDRHPALDAGELDALIARAEAQRDALESERIATGRRTFAPCRRLTLEGEPEGRSAEIEQLSAAAGMPRRPYDRHGEAKTRVNRAEGFPPPEQVMDFRG